MSLLKNDLSIYSSVNYIWTLAVLSPSELKTASYLNSTPNTVILRSGGYTKKQSIITNIEAAKGVNVEYFMDDVHIDSLYSPNPKTGITTATKIDFKITEPYSVGLFLQTITLAAIENGYDTNGFANVPLLMRCEFIGYDPSGKVLEMITRDLVLRLVNISFTVDAGGSIYQAEAIAWNQQALGDDVQAIKTDSKFYGNTVEEILSVGEKSLQAYLNKAEQDLVNDETKPYPNEYLIEFPDGLGNYIPTSNAATSSFVDMANANIKNTNLGNLTGFAAMANASSTPNKPSPVITASSAGSVAGTPRYGINIIGSSTVNTELNYMGNQEFALDSFVLDPTTHTYKNDLLTLGTDRSFGFKQNTKIEDMITQVILTSAFTKDVISKLETDTNQPLTWFRIETETILKNPQGQMQYIYKVIPYLVDRSLFEKNGVPRTYDRILSGVTKGYNYVYTGLNSEVLSFDISINSAFFKMFSTGTNRANTQIPTASGATTHDMGNFSSFVDMALTNIQSNNAVSGTNVTPSMSTAPKQQYTANIPTIAGGDGSVSAKKRVAETFQNIILNSNVELINIQLEVVGDPYFLPDSGMGNHVTERGMSYQHGEVDVIINFNTPVDYKDGLLEFNTSLDEFVGLYKIVQVSHSFQNGQFKQTLDMIRRPNQDAETLAAAKALLIENAIGEQIPNLQEILLSGSKNTSQLIFSMLLNNTNLSSIVSKVLAFQNIENMLPMPKDLLSAFGSITQFGSSITSISNELQTLYGGSSENLVKNFSTNLVKTMTSNLQNTISSITQPLTDLSTTLTSFTSSLSNPSMFASQINSSLTPSNTIAPPKIPPGDPTKIGPS